MTVVRHGIEHATDSRKSSAPLMSTLPRNTLTDTRRLAGCADCCLHRVSEKTVQISFCHNFVKFPQILISFGRKMAKGLKLCEMYSFFISANLRHHTTVLNAYVPNCYTMLKVVSIRLLTVASSIQ